MDMQQLNKPALSYTYSWMTRRYKLSVSGEQHIVNLNWLWEHYQRIRKLTRTFGAVYGIRSDAYRLAKTVQCECWYVIDQVREEGNRLGLGQWAEGQYCPLLVKRYRKLPRCMPFEDHKEKMIWVELDYNHLVELQEDYEYSFGKDARIQRRLDDYVYRWQRLKAHLMDCAVNEYPDEKATIYMCLGIRADT